jgi:hypothetical protein
MKNSKFRVNTNKEVLAYNLHNIKPGLEHDNYSTRSLAFTPEMENKMDSLRAKYKLSRSAIMRILLDSAE